MTELKAIPAAEEAVKKTLSDAENDRRNIESKIEKWAQVIIDARKAADAATISTDEKVFQKATAEYNKATELKEMYTARLQEMETEPLITAETYEGLVYDIYAEIGELEKETNARLRDLTEQMAEAGDALYATALRADKVLYALQHDLYKCMDIKPNAQGKREISKFNRKTTTNDRGPVMETYHWSQAAKKQYGYTKQASGYDQTALKWHNVLQGKKETR